MFTGMIQHQGRFLRYGRGKQEMTLESAALGEQLKAGDSLSVNGVCLTLTAKDKSGLVFNLSQETLSRTTLGGLTAGAPLNLELPLTLNTPLSGHLVTGHVDYRGKVVRLVERRPGRRMSVSLPPAARPLAVLKGSVAVDGVSLTVASVGASFFEVELIPLTLRETTLGRLRPGDAVNVECDIIGKYVYNRLSRGKR
ncbi:MAG: riboflavin synthase subunit alpha [Candidatus Aminicenantes bacterium RBG_13_62_12]|nr:MAG: riboflavin synthase subunit alpha [Candidatus Aminicenantes bacterium RBG_13_62_12]